MVKLRYFQHKHSLTKSYYFLNEKYRKFKSEPGSGRALKINPSFFDHFKEGLRTLTCVSKQPGFISDRGGQLNMTIMANIAGFTNST
jgi:hypothetical protein